MLKRVIFAMGVLWFSSANAQSFVFDNDDNAPLEITASDGIELRQKDNKIIAYKDVIAKKGEKILFADKMFADYHQGADEKLKVWKISAEGNIFMKAEESTAKGDTADYLFDDSIVSIKGNPAVLNTKTEETKANTLQYLLNKNQVIASGKATLLKEGRKLSADSISAIFTKDDDGKTVLKQMNASGNVVVATQEEQAFGDTATYFPDTAEATLSGNVKLTKNGNYLTGDKAIVNLATGVSRLLTEKNNSRVKGVFLPKSLKDSTREEVRE